MFEFVCKPCAESADSENEFTRILGHTRCVNVGRGEGHCDCQHRSTAEKVKE
jgi:hypothetical protein